MFIAWNSYEWTLKSGQQDLQVQYMYLQTGSHFIVHTQRKHYLNKFCPQVITIMWSVVNPVDWHSKHTLSHALDKSQSHGPGWLFSLTLGSLIKYRVDMLCVKWTLQVLKSCKQLPRHDIITLQCPSRTSYMDYALANVHRLPWLIIHLPDPHQTYHHIIYTCT